MYGNTSVLGTKVARSGAALGGATLPMTGMANLLWVVLAALTMLGLGIAVMHLVPRHEG